MPRWRRNAFPPLLLLLVLTAVGPLRQNGNGQPVGIVHAQLGVQSGNLCSALNNCNGHGRCYTASKTCICFEGYGADTDITNYKAPDCSLRTSSLLAEARIFAMMGSLWIVELIKWLRMYLMLLAGVCPSGPSWSGIPSASDTAHPRAECSDAGLCDRGSGQCRCLVGYDGAACQRCKTEHLFAFFIELLFCVKS